MYVRYIITIICVLFSCTSWAQYEATYSHYFAMQSGLNAGAVGSDDALNIVADYNFGLASFEGNPKTVFASVDAPFYFLKAKQGAGVEFMNDAIGVFSHQRIELKYAAKVKLFGGTLSLGAEVGLLTEAYDADEVDLEDSSDPAFASSDQTGNGLDLGAGIYYTRKSLWLGFSCQHINAATIELGDYNEIELDRTYYLMGGYGFRLRNPYLTVAPSVMLRTDLTAWRSDITCRLVYSVDERHLYAGLGVSPNTSFSVYVGGKFHGVMLGYSYEYYTSGLSFEDASHELFIGYQMDLNMAKKGKNKHQSLRLL